MRDNPIFRVSVDLDRLNKFIFDTESTAAEFEKHLLRLQKVLGIEALEEIVNSSDQNGFSLLHTACSLGRLSFSRVLMAFGANINRRDKFGQTPVYCISETSSWFTDSENKSVIEQIEEATEALKSLKDEDISLEEVKRLVRLGADINKSNVLQRVVTFDYMDIFVFLLKECDADIMEVSAQYMRRFVNSNNLTSVRALLDKGARVVRLSVNTSDEIKNLFTQVAKLHEVVSKGYYDQVLELINSGVSVNGCNLTGTSLLHIAAKKGLVEIAQLLLERRANTEAIDNFESTPLWYAARESAMKIVELLLENDASPSAADGNNITPIGRASKNGHAEIVKLLAFKYGNFSIVIDLINSGALVDQGFKNKFLDASISYGKSHREYIKYAFSHGANMFGKVA